MLEQGWIIPSAIWSAGAILLVALATALFKFASWRGAVNSDISTLKGATSRIHDNIDRIHDNIGKVFLLLAGKTASTFDKQSPMALNDLGKKISKAVNAKEWALQVAPKFQEKIAGKTSYGIQEFAIRFALNEFTPDDEYSNKLQACAFENGIAMTDVRYVLAIRLRDQLLELKQGAPHETDA